MSYHIIMWMKEDKLRDVIITAGDTQLADLPTGHTFSLKDSHLFATEFFSI